MVHSADNDFPRLFARGFLLSRSVSPQLEELRHFDKRRFSEWILYSDSLTEVETASQGSVHLIIVGKVLFSTHDRSRLPGKTLADSLLQKYLLEGFLGVEGPHYDMGGRFAILLIKGQEVYAWGDATSSRSVYFNSEKQEISSHFRILVDHYIGAEITWPYGMTSKVYSDALWDITAHPKIRILRANMRLDLQGGAQKRFHLLEENPARQLTNKERVHELITRSRDQIQQMVQLRPRQELLISLSGGLDSRTNLALIKSHAEYFTGFTYTVEDPVKGATTAGTEKILSLDGQIIHHLEPYLPSDMRYIVRPRDGKLPRRQGNILKKNSVGSHGRWLLPFYKENFPSLNTTHLRGNIWGLSRRVFSKDGDGSLQAVNKFNARWAKSKGNSEEVIKLLSEDKALEFEMDKIHPDYEPMDIFYWENRLTRWLAEIYNETDVVFDTLSAINTRRILDILLSPPPHERRSAKIQYDAMHEITPELTFLPLNGHQNLYEKGLRRDLLNQLSGTEY